MIQGQLHENKTSHLSRLHTIKQSLISTANYLRHNTILTFLDLSPSSLKFYIGFKFSP